MVGTTDRTLDERNEAILIAPSKKKGKHAISKQRRGRKLTEWLKCEIVPSSPVDKMRLIPFRSFGDLKIGMLTCESRRPIIGSILVSKELFIVEIV